MVAGNKDPQKSRAYCIRVLTSDKLGAGTDSKVHIVLEDESGKRSAPRLTLG